MAPRNDNYSNSAASSDEIHSRLDELLRTVDRQLWLSNDPLKYAHRYEATVDQEVAGLVAASLAFGNVTVVHRSVQQVLEALGEHPAETVIAVPKTVLRRRLTGFTHRIYRAPHIARLLANVGAVLREHESLGGAFVASYQGTGAFRPALAEFAERLRGPRPDRSMRHLISDPLAGSACKRLLLYARWMIRPSDGLDLGLWPVPASELIMPVDTHVHRIARHLGLTERNDASWRTAEEITERLRGFDPGDPVKYDFALCHMGISRQCPSRPDPERCSVCVLKPACRVWR